MFELLKFLLLDFLQKKREQGGTTQMCRQHPDRAGKGLPEEGADTQLSPVSSGTVSPRGDVIP